MFNHKVSLNQATLEGAAAICTKYGHFVLSDSLDINWYKEDYWIEDFQKAVEEIKEGETVTFLKDRDYQVRDENGYFTISSPSRRVEGLKTQIAIIPNYLENDLFLFLSTLLRADYDIAIK